MNNKPANSLLALAVLIIAVAGCQKFKGTATQNTSVNLSDNKSKVENYNATPTVTDAKTSGKAIAWNLANKLSMAALLHSKGVEATDSLTKADILAEEVGAVIPPLPVNTGDNIKDMVAAMSFLLNDVHKNVGGSILRKYGQKEADLFDMGLKTNTLLLIYGPGEKEGRAVANVIRRDAKSADLPENLWMPTVKKIESNASFDEVKDAILQMQTDVNDYLSKS